MENNVFFTEILELFSSFRLKNIVKHPKTSVSLWNITILRGNIAKLDVLLQCFTGSMLLDVLFQCWVKNWQHFSSKEAQKKIHFSWKHFRFDIGTKNSFSLTKKRSKISSITTIHYYHRFLSAIIFRGENNRDCKARY